MTGAPTKKQGKLEKQRNKNTRLLSASSYTPHAQLSARFLIFHIK